MKRDARAILRDALRIALFLICFVTYSLFIKAFTGPIVMGAYEFTDLAEFQDCLHIFLTMLFMYSLIRQAVIYNPTRRELFYAKSIPSRFWKHFVFSVCSVELWVKNAVFAAIYLLIPARYTVDLFSFPLVSVTGRVQKLIAVFTIVVFIELCAHFSAIRFWRSDKFKSPENPDKAFFAAMRFTIPMYFFSAFLLMKVIIPYGRPVILLIGYVLFSVELWIWAAIFFGIYLLVHNFRLYRKRRKFIKRLTAICRDQGYTLSKINSPYRSLFWVTDGESFTVSNGKNDYSCKIVTCRSKLKPLVILPNGNLKFLTQIRLRGTVLYQYEKERTFDYPSDKAKLLIVNPSPKLAKTVYAGKWADIDNGDLIGETRIFTASAFMNALERNVLERYE